MRKRSAGWARRFAQRERRKAILALPHILRLERRRAKVAR